MGKIPSSQNRRSGLETLSPAISIKIGLYLTAGVLLLFFSAHPDAQGFPLWLVLLEAAIFTALPISSFVAERRNLRSDIAGLRREAEAARAGAADAERKLALVMDCAPVDLVLSEDGVVTGFTARPRPDADRLAVAEAIEEAKRAAAQASQAKADFIANMSHELRTPLTAILGFSELLMGAELRPTERHYVGRVRDASETLMTIVNDVLDCSNIEDGHLELAPETVDLSGFVRESAAVLGGQASLKGLSITTEIEDGLPEHVKVDSTRLRQILLNLLGNAIKFTPRGGQITLNVEAEAWGRLRFSINDTGVGIPPDQQAGLFQRFTQADSTATRQFGGAGLGLAICAGLAKVMGGEIGVKSQLGAGATFWFTVDAPAAVQEAGASEPAVLPDTLSVLLVEDNPANRQLFKALLGPLDIQITEAVNGAEGVEAAKRGAFDLIVMDIQMPVMNGIEATKAIRRLGAPLCD
ncbi:MAG: ATP-binding protein, partial [Caulobacteraceae bacterium]